MLFLYTLCNAQSGVVELQPIINRSLTTAYATEENATAISVAKPEAPVAVCPRGRAIVSFPHYHAGARASVGRTISKLRHNTI